jgi:hypothetical protein
MSNKKALESKAINDSIIGIAAKPTRRDKPQSRQITDDERKAIAERKKKEDSLTAAYDKAKLVGSRVSPTVLAALVAAGLTSKK